MKNTKKKQANGKRGRKINNEWSTGKPPVTIITMVTVWRLLQKRSHTHPRPTQTSSLHPTSHSLLPKKYLKTIFLLLYAWPVGTSLAPVFNNNESEIQHFRCRDTSFFWWYKLGVLYKVLLLTCIHLKRCLEWGAWQHSQRCTGVNEREHSPSRSTVILRIAENNWL